MTCDLRCSRHGLELNYHTVTSDLRCSWHGLELNHHTLTSDLRHYLILEIPLDGAIIVSIRLARSCTFKGTLGSWLWDATLGTYVCEGSMSSTRVTKNTFCVSDVSIVASLYGKTGYLRAMGKITYSVGVSLIALSAGAPSSSPSTKQFVPTCTQSLAVVMDHTTWRLARC